MLWETLEKRFMNTRITSKNHDNIWPYGLRALCLFHFLWALSPKIALGVKESEHRQNDDFGSKTAQKRLRNGWGAATPSKTTTIFEPIGVLTRYRTSALKVCWSSSLRRQRVLNVKEPMSLVICHSCSGYRRGSASGSRGSNNKVWGSADKIKITQD